MSAGPSTRASLRAGTWLVQAGSTRATFSVGNLGKSVQGSVPVRSGELVVDTGGAPQRLSAELDLAGLVTGSSRRDKDLRKPRLLDLDAHPTMSFVSERIAVHDEGWTAQGTLSARGTSCPLTLHGGLPGQPDEDGIVQVEATAVVDRRDLGVRAPRLMIGRQVSISVTARLASA